MRCFRCLLSALAARYRERLSEASEAAQRKFCSDNQSPPVTAWTVRTFECSSRLCTGETVSQWRVEVHQSSKTSKSILSFNVTPTGHLSPCGGACAGADPARLQKFEPLFVADANKWLPVAWEISVRPGGFATLIDVERDVERSLLETLVLPTVHARQSLTPAGSAGSPSASASGGTSAGNASASAGPGAGSRSTLTLPGDSDPCQCLGGLFVYMLSHLLAAPGPHLGL